MNLLTAGALALAIGVIPMTASAVTTVTEVGGPYDLLADVYKFEGDYAAGTLGDTLTFNFVNSSDTAAAVTFFGITLNQLSAAFTNGVQFTFGPIADSLGSTSTGDDYQFLVAAGQAISLVITFGDVFDTNSRTPIGEANLDFQIQAAAVPVPAAGLLLLTALGGLAAIRRRKAS